MGFSHRDQPFAASLAKTLVKFASICVKMNSQTFQGIGTSLHLEIPYKGYTVYKKRIIEL